MLKMQHNTALAMKLSKPKYVSRFSQFQLYYRDYSKRKTRLMLQCYLLLTLSLHSGGSMNSDLPNHAWRKIQLIIPVD